MPRTPVSPAADGVTLAVRITPKACRNSIEGVAKGADGRVRLRISVTAPPEDGKANAAVLALLAKSWRLPKRAFSVKSGAAAREKTIHIAGDAAALAPRLEELIGSRHG